MTQCYEKWIVALYLSFHRYRTFTYGGITMKKKVVPNTNPELPRFKNPSI